MKLVELGWEPFFQRQFDRLGQADLSPGRVIRDGRGLYVVRNEEGDWQAEVTGEFRYHAGDRGAFPVAGDWVGMVVRPAEGQATIRLRLDRKTTLSRKVAGSVTEEQVMAANVDIVFLVNGLDGGRNFNLRRLEREMAMVWESGASPVVVLNKADLAEDLAMPMEEARAVAPGVPVLAVSASRRQGLEELRSSLPGGKTGILLGPSGVGKTSLINALLDDESRKVGAVRSDDRRGRHTTTYRELVFMPGGGMIVDTPGLREIQLWGDGDGVEAAFEEIEALAAQCRFSDCRHEGEPGCAVNEALAKGEIDQARYENYLQLKREQAYLARRKDRRLQQAEQAKWKRIAKDFRVRQRVDEKFL